MASPSSAGHRDLWRRELAERPRHRPIEISRSLWPRAIYALHGCKPCAEAAPCTAPWFWI